jgi:hypothetical protein
MHALEEPHMANVRPLKRCMRLSATLSVLIGLTTVISSQPAVAADKGLLLMRVNGARLNNVGKVVGRASLFSFAVQNVETKATVWHNFPNRVAAFEVEEGIYCLATVSLMSNFPSDYCGEPYFRVVAGRVNNAGTWYYGFAVADRIAKLVSAVGELDKTMLEAESLEGELLQKYGRVVTPK